MKKSIFSLLCLLTFSLVTWATNVPDAVKHNFSERFPKATLVNWSNNESGFKADFKVGGKSLTAIFKANGEWDRTEFEVPVSEVSSNAQTATAKVLLNASIVKAVKVEDAEHGRYYRLNLSSGQNQQTALIRESGEILQ